MPSGIHPAINQLLDDFSLQIKNARSYFLVLKYVKNHVGGLIEWIRVVLKNDQST